LFDSFDSKLFSLWITKRRTIIRNFRPCGIPIDYVNNLKTVWFTLFKVYPVAFCLPAMRLARRLNVVPFMLISSSLCSWCIQRLWLVSRVATVGTLQRVGLYMSLCRESGNTGVTFSSMVTNMQLRRRNRNIVIHRTIELLFMRKM